jgi:hypothetical protein
MMRLEDLGLQATTGANSFEISGVWYGPKAEFWGVIQPLKERRRGVNGRRRVIVVRVGDGSRGRMMRLEVVRRHEASRVACGVSPATK